MPEYTYIARDRFGQRQDGSMSARSAAAAVDRLRARGYRVERVRVEERGRAEKPRRLPEPIREAGRRFTECFVLPVTSGVPMEELARFYRRLAQLTSSGTPLEQALARLRGAARNRRMRDAIGLFEQQAARGGSFSEVLASHPWIFTGPQREMMRAAEYGRTQEEMLGYAADHLEQEIVRRDAASELLRVVGTTAFAIWMVLGGRFFVYLFHALSDLVAGRVTLFEMFFIMPTAMAMLFNGPQAGGRSDYTVASYLMDTVGTGCSITLALFAVVALCRVWLFRSPANAHRYEALKQRLPGIGRVSHAFALGRMARALASLYAAGVPIGSAIRTAGEDSGNVALAKAAEQAAQAADRGDCLSRAFALQSVFPPMVIAMLQTGEETGNVDSALQKVAEYLEGEAHQLARVYTFRVAAPIAAIALLITAACMA